MFLLFYGFGLWYILPIIFLIYSIKNKKSKKRTIFNSIIMAIFLFAIFIEIDAILMNINFKNVNVHFKTDKIIELGSMNDRYETKDDLDKNMYAMQTNKKFYYVRKYKNNKYKVLDTDINNTVVRYVKDKKDICLKEIHTVRTNGFEYYFFANYMNDKFNSYEIKEFYIPKDSIYTNFS